MHHGIIDHFDIIGVDPRGLGMSAPLVCDSAYIEDRWDQPEWPLDQDSLDTLIERNKAFYQSCIDNSGPLVNYMDTVSVAKDYEAVRLALGDEKLTWFSQSYGTLLGTQYAELYPNNIRVMVLDGVLSNSLPEESAFEEAAEAMETTLAYFFDWCKNAHYHLCTFKHHPQETWIQAMDRAPIPAQVCLERKCRRTQVTEEDIRRMAMIWSYTPETGFPALAKALHEATLGDYGDASDFYPVREALKHHCSFCNIR